MRTEVHVPAAAGSERSHERHDLQGYRAQVEYDVTDEIFTGRITGIAAIVGFHADTMGDLKVAFHKAVEDYIEASSGTGEAPR